MNAYVLPIVVQSRGWRIHRWFFPRIFTILLLPTELLLAVVAPVRSSRDVLTSLVLPA